MHVVGLFVPDDFEMAGFAALSVFEAANAELGHSHYATRILSERGGRVAGAFGMEVFTHALAGDDHDTLIVAGASGLVPMTPLRSALLRKAAARCGRVAAIRLGTFALAEAGLLAGRRATTQRAHADDLQARFPDIRVEADRLFTEDGAVWTAAGMAAGIDLALRLVDQDVGRVVAHNVAAQLMIPELRTEAHSQHSAALDLQVKSDRVEMALAFARNNLRQKLTVDELADAACLSPRQFSRIFRSQTGCSPARAVEKLRLEAACVLIRQGRLPFETIAGETGFGDEERMRRAFTRDVGQAPRAIRKTALTVRAA